MMKSDYPEGSRLLFFTSFAAITATSFCFVLRALVIDDWGVQFALSETQKGELLGVGLWPFSITIVLMSLFIDRIGFRLTYWFAAVCHLVGLAVLLMAHGYWSLYAGTFIMALGNGAVEAAANPLIATVFSQDKPKWLNRVHAAWPGGMILGGGLAMMLGSAHWQVKVALMAVPVITYAIMLIGRKFPVSERVASGISYRTMLAEAGFISALILTVLIMLEVGRVFNLSPIVSMGSAIALSAVYAFISRSPGRPLYILLVLLMIPQAMTELSTDSWISSLMSPEMAAIGLNAGWVLIYTSLIVFVIRIFAGNLIDRFKPLGVLAFASALAAAGLFLLSGSTGGLLLAAATLYGIGKSFFWGTTLAVASEQFPKGGAVAINMLAGAGMLAAGILGSVLLGTAQDHTTLAGVKTYDRVHGTVLTDQYMSVHRASIFGAYLALDEQKMAKAVPADQAVLQTLVAGSKKAALKDIALLPLITLLIYLGLIIVFRRRGGYSPVILTRSTDT